MAAVFILTVILSSFMTAFADTAKMGDTVLVRVFVEGDTELITLRAFFTFDQEKFDYLSSDDCQVGITVVNDQVEGQFAWASIFDDSLSYFSKETQIMEITFIAKKDVENIESEFSLDIKDAYDNNSEMIDLSHIKTSVVVVGEGFSEESEAESKTSFEIKEYEGNGANPESGSVYQSGVSESNESNIVSTTETTTGTDNSDSVTDDSQNEIISESGTSSLSEFSTGFVMTYDEAEFAEQPPIKFDQQKKTDEHRTLKIVSVAAVSFCLIIALIAFIMLKMKKDD